MCSYQTFVGHRFIFCNNPKEKSYWLSIKRTSVMLTFGLAYKNMLSLYYEPVLLMLSLNAEMVNNQLKSKQTE